MKRFSTFSEATPHAYSEAEIAAMSDSELVDEINRNADWDADLLHDLVWRAFPDREEPFECGDPVCYEAAEKLGYEI